MRPGAQLAHLRRRDHWVGRLELLAGWVWWWSPLFWWVRRRLHVEAELACDAWVIRLFPDARRAYAEALLEVCDSLSRPTAPTPALGVLGGSAHLFERRLRMILRSEPSGRLPRRAALAIGLLALLALPAWPRPTGDGPPPDGPALPEVDPAPPPGPSTFRGAGQDFRLEIIPPRANRAVVVFGEPVPAEAVIPVPCGPDCELDWPTADTFWKALSQARPDVPPWPKGLRDNLQVAFHELADPAAGPCEPYPGLGACRMIRCSYSCTFWGGRGLPTRGGPFAFEVLHLHCCNDPKHDHRGIRETERPFAVEVSPAFAFKLEGLGAGLAKKFLDIIGHSNAFGVAPAPPGAASQLDAAARRINELERQVESLKLEIEELKRDPDTPTTGSSGPQVHERFFAGVFRSLRGFTDFIGTFW